MADDAEERGGGPYQTVPAFGVDVPVYLIRFDKHGTCLSPLSAGHLISALEAGPGDVILYSHGWNNDFPTARARMLSFLDELSKAAASSPEQLPSAFAPVFVGIIWPSTALTFGGEDAPEIAGDAPAAADARLDDLTEGHGVEARALLNRAVQGDNESLQRLAAIMVPQLADAADPELTRALDADDLLAIWAASPDSGPPDEGSFDDFGSAIAVPSDLNAAGGLGSLDPRWLVRMATVLQMKNRAGVVGRGVGQLLRRILAVQRARVFLVGHSYGAKVIMSALAVERPTRPAEAALLLQPAVSRLCFAQDIGTGRAGGFRSVLDRVVKPIVTTFSKNDFPLTTIFHLVARRASDLGEIQALGAPSRYAALGGFGPAGCVPDECVAMSLAEAPAPYEWPHAPARVVALDGSAVISSHGDVSSPATAWMMLNLLR